MCIYIYMIFGFLRLEALQCVGRTWIHMAFFTCHVRERGTTRWLHLPGPKAKRFFSAVQVLCGLWDPGNTLGTPWDMLGSCQFAVYGSCFEICWMVCVCLIDYHLLLSSTVITYHQISLTFINYIWLSTLTSFIISHDFSSPAHVCFHELRSSRCRGYITEKFFRCSTGLCPTDGSRFLFGHLWAMYTSATREVEYFFLTINC